jgi:hypothetical protein
VSENEQLAEHQQSASSHRRSPERKMNVTLTDEGYTLDGKWRLVPSEYMESLTIPNPPQSLSSIPPDCRTCANRGQVNGLSQESYCESCVHQGRGWLKNHFVDVSEMVDAVKRRCEACAILPCSCK